MRLRLVLLIELEIIGHQTCPVLCRLGGHTSFEYTAPTGLVGFANAASAGSTRTCVTTGITAPQPGLFCSAVEMTVWVVRAAATTAAAAAATVVAQLWHSEHAMVSESCQLNETAAALLLVLLLLMTS